MKDNPRTSITLRVDNWMLELMLSVIPIITSGYVIGGHWDFCPWPGMEDMVSLVDEYQNATTV